MFHFKSPRDNALFMTGMTFGICVGCFGMVVAFGTKTTDFVFIVTPLILGVTMTIVTFINYRRFTQLDK